MSPSAPDDRRGAPATATRIIDDAAVWEARRWKRETQKYANELLLSASKQAGILAAALIAASQLWTTKPLDRFDKWTIGGLIATILLSGLVHLALGIFVQRRAEEIAHDQSPASGSRRASAATWILGFLQLITLAASVSGVAIRLINAAA